MHRTHARRSAVASVAAVVALAILAAGCTSTEATGALDPSVDRSTVERSERSASIADEAEPASTSSTSSTSTVSTSTTTADDGSDGPSIAARAASSSVQIGEGVAITGQVQPAGSIATVVAQRLVDGAWVDRQVAEPDEKGRFSIEVRPSEAARYRMRVRSSGGSVASDSFAFVAWTPWIDDAYDAGAKPGSRVVALTFDDGPSPTYTPQILDVLAAHDVPATFFVLGRSVTQWPELATRAVDEGHRLANHTWDHPVLTDVSDDGIIDQVRRTDDEIARAGGTSVCVRPPQGRHDERVSNVIGATLGQSLAMWNVDTRDWRDRSASSIVERALSQVRPGSVILMHDGGGDRTATVEALDQLIVWLKVLRYEFVTIC